MTTVPLYVTSNVVTGSGVQQSRSTVQPGATLAHPGDSTIAVQKVFNPADTSDQVTWSATLTKDGKTESLKALPDCGIKPGAYAATATKGFAGTHFQLAGQSFALPWSPGASVLTLVAQDAAGKVFAQESFNVEGTYASVLRPQQ